MRAFILLFASTIALFATPSAYEQGKKLYFGKGCNGCHGISAGGSSQYPALANRRKPFLIDKLKGYRAKKGATQLSQIMIPFAIGLSDTQIDALTTFFSEFKESSSHDKTERSSRGDGGS
ncbi:MAG: c-type cytochrome [Sulfuricurvum sp.]|nr:c-type cytochrome [Sulfuricurvum sp.]MDP3464267.1 c-type cytochrome [Sulfuricurvum sp.]